MTLQAAKIGTGFVARPFNVMRQPEKTRIAPEKMAIDYGKDILPLFNERFLMCLGQVKY